MERVITAVIPAFGEIGIVKNSVVSLATQWIPDDEFRLEIIIVNDNPKMNYSYFLGQEFQKIVNDNIVIKIINNENNYGQGISRQIGIDNASSNWILLCDEDDMYATNAVYRFWEILNEQHYGGEDGKGVALISAPLYSFEKNKERKIINAKSIWVNGKLYNRQFLRENMIMFPTGKNSHRSEDYPFIKMLDYAIENNFNYKRVDFDDDADTFYYWIPNQNSRTRCEKFYSALLTPFTMKSSLMIFKYQKWFNEYHNIVKDKDEEMKHTILNMCVYAYFNYNHWLFCMNQGWKDDKKFLEEDWEMYKSVLKGLRDELKYYWNEIVPSDIFLMLSSVKMNSDVNFVESWLGSFETWVTKGFKTDKMSFGEIKEYCGSLSFDTAKHETNSSYSQAWKKRNKI